MRKKLDKLLEKQVFNKMIREEVKTLRIAYVARCNGRMFNISYKIARRKGGGGGAAAKAMEKRNEQTGKLVTAMAAQNATMQQTLKEVMAETKEDRELAKKSQTANANVIKQLLIGQADASKRNHDTQAPTSTMLSGKTCRWECS
jgi:hypothetical protein